MWFRLSGEDEEDEKNWRRKPVEPYTVDEITKFIADSHITHMVVKGDLPPLATVAPQLTHLKILDISDVSQLQRYVLCRLVVNSC